jgi:hypothetical protein
MLQHSDTHLRFRYVYSLVKLPAVGERPFECPGPCYYSTYFVEPATNSEAEDSEEYRLFLQTILDSRP